MATRVRLFISAGPAEEPARELLGRALAELPVNIGWIIKRTPDVDAVAECHLFVLVMGADIVAPVGLELWWALRTEKPILAYAAGIGRTPAGQVFWQENALLDWTRYADLPGLHRAFVTDISRFLLAHPDRYGLTLFEAERLRLWVAELDRRPAATQTQPPGDAAFAKATGAGGGGVILAPGKDDMPGAHNIGEAPGAPKKRT